MKILHVIHSLDLRSGGPSHAIRNLVREQVRSGHDVALLSTTVQSTEPWAPQDQYINNVLQDPELRGAEIHLARSYGRRPPWSRYAYSPAASGWLRSRLRNVSERPEIIHIHGTFSHITHEAAKWASKTSIPYILRPAGCLSQRCLGQGRTYLKQAFQRLFLRNDLNRASLIHATSEYEAKGVKQAGCKSAVCIVPHGVDLQSDADYGSESVTQLYPQLKGRRIVLFMSRIHAIKRPELLIRAISYARTALPDIGLMIAGSDAGHLAVVKKNLYEYKLQDVTAISGFLQGKAKQAAMSAASLFALPSIHENFGVAVVEAMAHGTPVLVTPGVASHVYVDESGCGLTVADTVEGFAEGICTLLNQGRNELGQRGRDYVRNHLSWAAVGVQIDDMYHNAIKFYANHQSCMFAEP